MLTHADEAGSVDRSTSMAVTGAIPGSSTPGLG